METEITKLKIDTKLDKMIVIELLWVQLFDGWACDKCGIIQGESRKGFKKYYCEHLPRLDRKLNHIRKRIAQEIAFDVKQKIELKKEVKG
jgi:hypothetical protein